jgi:translation initiation factor IF-1
VIVAGLAGGVWRVELANGYRLIARWPRRQSGATPPLAVGDRLRLEVTPFDLSKGLIVCRES